MSKLEETSLDFKRLLLKISGGFLAVYSVALLFQAIAFSNNFGPNVRIAGISLSGKNEKESIAILEGAWREYSRSQIEIEGERFNISELVESVSYKDVISDALRDQQNEIFTFGGFKNRDYSISITAKEDNIYKIISRHYDKDSVSAVDAKIFLKPQEKVTPSRLGRRLLIAESKEAIGQGLGKLQQNIGLKYETVKPALAETRAELLILDAKNATSSSIILNYNSSQYQISPSTLMTWLRVEPADAKSIVEREIFNPEATGKENYTYFDRIMVANHVSTLESKINRSEVNAKLAAKDGKVTVVTPAVIGAKLDLGDTAQKIQQAGIDHEEKELKVDIKKPEVTESNLTELGLNELISTGWSDFKGSPKNRVHNVTNGASKFNGVLIRPDERFSFNKALGEVDASTGYLPELVILENKTVPQFGGGLCQVSSTAFRAALNSGLPILERLYHAYPVSYYKPFGVDATIYLPKPDLVFQNDTGNYILIQTHIEGTKLSFDFYGTKSARMIKFSGNEKAEGAVNEVEKMTPGIYDQDLRGKGSFTAIFYRHIYDSSGRLTDNDKFISKYDSPDKYPH